MFPRSFLGLTTHFVASKPFPAPAIVCLPPRNEPKPGWSSSVPCEGRIVAFLLCPRPGFLPDRTALACGGLGTRLRVIYMGLQSYARARPGDLKLAEASGSTQWFEELLDQLGHEVWIGDAAAIRAI